MNYYLRIYSFSIFWMEHINPINQKQFLLQQTLKQRGARVAKWFFSISRRSEFGNVSILSEVIAEYSSTPVCCICTIVHVRTCVTPLTIHMLSTANNLTFLSDNIFSGQIEVAVNDESVRVYSNFKKIQKSFDFQYVRTTDL